MKDILAYINKTKNYILTSSFFINYRYKQTTHNHNTWFARTLTVDNDR